MNDKLEKLKRNDEQTRLHFSKHCQSTRRKERKPQQWCYHSKLSDPTRAYKCAFTPAGILDYHSTKTQRKNWKRKTELLILKECGNQFNIEIQAIWVVSSN